MESSGKIIIASPTQTGDTPHIAAALALASKTGVFLVYNTDPKSDDPLLQFYKQAASITKNPVLPFCPKPTFKRVSGIDYDPIAQQTRVSKSLYAEMKKRIDEGSFEWTQDSADVKTYEATRNMSLDGFPALLKDYSNYRPVTVSGATTIVAKQFKVDKRNAYTILAKVLASTLTSQEIIKDMSNWNLKSPFPFPKASTDKPILLVWSRYTGQNSSAGYNPAGDSDPRGQEQLIELGKSLGFAVVTIGHGPPESRKATKVEPDCHLGEFYKNKIIESKGRAGQVSFFLALLEACPGKIIQIGQKTGGMDSAALLGMPTIYIEDKRSPTATRMVRWIGSVPFYRRAFIENPPTPLGRTLRELTGGFADAEIQDIPLRFRVLTWVRILTAKGDTKTDPHLKALEAAIGKTLWGNIFNMKTMLENPDISEDALLKWLERMQTMNPEALEAAGVKSGYADTDLEIIKTELSDLKGSLGDPNSIVRNKAGAYVKLSEVKWA
ncbi:hypothetical protein CPB86DRAFT_790291 [Serendipita vermifera]|nr:hypothetical protein CPB86DRAFT_790291 [Serendipita vermifera]